MTRRPAKVPRASRPVAYYNDIDPFVCQYLRNLMDDDLIPPGDVDERPIEEVQPSDLTPYTQAHFFAGLGGWPYTLRLAGWPDSVPVWTGSCPCPPFSSAAPKKRCPECGGMPIPCPVRTGFFICLDCNHEYYADSRHLWPEFHRLIHQCQPPTLFGEQVSGEDGRIWLGGVRACLVFSGYATGASNLCAAGVGAPHIRQRLYWGARSRGVGMAYPDGGGLRPRGSGDAETQGTGAASTGRASSGTGETTANGGSGADGVGNASSRGRRQGSGGGPIQGQGPLCPAAGSGEVDDRMGNAEGGIEQRVRESRPGRRGSVPTGGPSSHADDRVAHPQSHGSNNRESGVETGSEQAACGDGQNQGRRESKSTNHGHSTLRLSHPHRPRLSVSQRQARQGTGPGEPNPATVESGTPRIHPHWSDFVLVQRKDGKWCRIPTQPELFPLADGFSGRVGLLRSAGNAIVPQVAAEFVLAFTEALDDVKL